MGFIGIAREGVALRRRERKEETVGGEHMHGGLESRRKLREKGYCEAADEALYKCFGDTARTCVAHIYMVRPQDKTQVGRSNTKHYDGPL
jgi:hypothetical protein